MFQAQVVAMVLAGGSTGTSYGPLLASRPKGALTFAGVYRVIDFTLSRLRTAGIDHVGIPIQYLPGSLIEHVGVGHPWDFHGHGRILKVMPPFVGVEATSWYHGTGDALLRNWNFIRDTQPEHVLVMSGEHIHNMDVAGALRTHLNRMADVTFLTVQMPANRLSPRFGYVHASGDGRVSAYIEKPTQASGLIVSTGAYVFRTSVLEDLLRANEQAESHNLAADILAPAVSSLHAVEARMQGATWEYLAGPEDYLDAHLRLATTGNHDFPIAHWDILTNLEYRNTATRPAPHIYRTAEVSESLLSGGCSIWGQANLAVLSPGVQVAQSACVTKSVILHDSRVGSGAQIFNSVVDKDCIIAEGAVIGQPDGPVTLIGKGVQICEGVVVPAGAQIPPGTVIRPKSGVQVGPEEAAQIARS
jgi:glucose-1-phosphate adenylyltransferase